MKCQLNTDEPFTCRLEQCELYAKIILDHLNLQHVQYMCMTTLHSHEHDMHVYLNRLHTVGRLHLSGENYQLDCMK